MKPVFWPRWRIPARYCSERLTEGELGGVYLLEGDHAGVGAVSGAESPVLRGFRLAGRGVCGAAVAQNKVQRIIDVHAFDGHIACDAASNASIAAMRLANGLSACWIYR